MTDSVFSAASCSCVRGASRWPCSVSLSRRCRVKRSFSVTFSPCLLSQPLSSAFLRVFLVFVDWQVPGKTAFCHHLEFVVSGALLRPPSGRCRVKWSFSVTFSPCLLNRPLSSAFLRVFLFFVDWQVPGKTAFCHHLLEFVVSGPASEASLTHCSGPRPEGAG